MSTSLITPKRKNQKRESYNGKRLTWQMREFVDHLLTDIAMNPVEAARKVNYENPHSAASKLLRNPLVKAYLRAEMSQRQERCRSTAADTIRYLELAVFHDPLKYFSPGGKGGGFLIKPEDLENVPSEIRSLIEECETQEIETEHSTIRMCRVRFVSKTKMAEYLCKHHGVFEKDNRQQSRPVLDISQLYERPVIVDEVEEMIANPEPPLIIDHSTQTPVGYSVDELTEEPQEASDD